MKNFVFISPNFPYTYYRFVSALKKNGFRVLGVGDTPYNDLHPELKRDLTEYYGCWGMDNFDNEVAAIRFFENKYGHIDYLESNNEYWLRKDARLRDMFYISTGVQGETINTYQYKSKMKEKYIKAGANVANWIIVEDYDQVKEFVKKYGYPIFIKPDIGVGAAGDFKIKNDGDLKAFFDKKLADVPYICEQFISGQIISFDGVSNSKGDVIFCASNHFPPSISDIVQQKKDVFYYCGPTVDKDLEEIGRKVIKAFEVKNRFFHLEFFRLDKDCPGVAKKGEIVALETNMRPAGGYTPDLINYALSINCYQIYADSMAFDENRQDMSHEKYFAACASRRDENEYEYNDDQILEMFKPSIVYWGRYPEVFSGAMGNRFFMARFINEHDMEVFRECVERKKGGPIKVLKTEKKTSSEPIADRHIDAA